MRREVDENGMPRWELCRDVDEHGFVWLWQRLTEPRGERPSIIIGDWPEKLETDELADAQAIIDEHDGTAWPKP